MDKKVIGILGGMGPYATLAFFQKLLDLTPAKKDWEHLRIIIDNNPHIPSRSRYLLYDEESPIEGMVDSCRKLQRYPVDVIAIPCNSACYFIDKVQDEIDVPILNIMEITSNSLASIYPNIKKVSVLGGAITYNKKTYEKFLKQNDIEYVHHNKEIQDKVEFLIEKIKLNSISEELKVDFYDLLEELKKSCNIQGVILGCTEFGCLMDIQTSIKILDSSTELAKYILKNFS
ncbi:aspartate/glutamate racemase family protein [Clostridium botulinum]|uniref:aspartate/glutamate racemase family protein n=1 Tax=Clostridium botulinum TaxID=1491 RepID=UPI0013F00358|nr:amino acid racemase [Clostridium botulinum]MBY6916656.1 aspartate/glutamate racemase family protein [Clostridium botulinum]NFL36180.1 aspartate/glutamate racemase family protein [Clostridium botulinum]NFM04799.1 aspartate/glutamate racemase family protein [Clostridium botulinum]NFO41185.1 aspartate/glutamate racemase family protein [Clostridium botulinum]NFQ39388.1 aspartate/glutamate racemase family protein [Clostridium botulinum]